MKWKKVKLSDITEVITKGTTPTTIGYNYTETGINFVKIESISNEGTFLLDKLAYISEECNNKMYRSQLRENDILFSIAGAIGRTAIVTKDILPANTNQALAIIRLNTKDITSEFILLSLKAEYIYRQFNKKKQGVAQINLSLKDISELEIVYPSICEQEKIVNILDKAQELIDKRKEQIELLDELVKSRFVEMFGSLYYNNKNWNENIISDYCQVKGGKRVPKGERLSDEPTEHPYLRVLDLKNSTVVENDIKYLTDEIYEKIKRYTITSDDVYLTNVGEKIRYGRYYT